jgi:hypothetical protein
MITKIRFLLFFFVSNIFHFHLSFSQPLSPSISFPFYNCSSLSKDSTFLNLSNYRRNYTNRKFGYYDNLISRFSISNCESLDFDFGVKAFYDYTHQNFFYSNLDTLKAISNLQFVLGTKREQMLFLDHKQRLAKNLTAAFSYHSLVTEGFYKHSFAKSKAINVELNYNTEKYSAFAYTNFNNLESNENGGVINAKPINGLSKSELLQLNVNLPADSRKNKSNFYGLKQNLKLADIASDSINSRGIYLDLNVLLDKTAFNYKGLVGDFYDNAFLDTLNTNDTLGYINLSSIINLKYLQRSNLSTTEFSISSERNDFDLLIDSLSSDFYDYSLKAGIRFSNSKWKALLNSSFVLGNSYRNKQMFQNMFIENSNKKFILSRFYAGISYSRTAAPFTYLNFISNNFIWNNSFSKLAENANIYAGFTLYDEIVGLKFISHSYKDRFFVNSSATPEQSTKNEQLNSVELELNKSIGKFYLSILASYTNSNSVLLPTPEWRNESSFSYRSKFFKSALKAEFGFTVVYTSSWYAPAYMPSSGLFYLQNNSKVEGAPIVHFFANLGIKSATIFLRFERLNYGALGNDYFFAPGYAAPPRTLKFGVFWLLKN